MVQNNESVFFVECDSYKESPSTSPIRLDDLDGNDAVSDRSSDVNIAVALSQGSGDS